MGSVDKNSLLNQVTFAKRCGVSASTIRTYVDKHKIVPAQEVENRVFFTPDQVYDFKASSVKELITQSFLCVVCDDDSSKVETIQKTMLVDIAKECPNAYAIKGLAQSIKTMSEEDDVKPTDDVLNVIKSKVATAFVIEVRKVIASIICEVFAEEPSARDYTFGFFLSYVCDKDIDASLVESYRGVGISVLPHTLDGLKQRCQLQFDNLARRFGVFLVCNSINFGIWDAFAEDGSRLLQHPDFKFDSSSADAKSIYEKTLGSSSDDRVMHGAKDICRNGFYTFYTGVSSLSDEDCVDIISKLNSDEYTTILVSSRAKLPKVISISLDALEKTGSVKVKEY